MSEPALFVPNELETHLLAIHRVPARQIAYYRRHCKENNIDYNEFLKTNHNVLHMTREKHVPEEEE